MFTVIGWSEDQQPVAGVWTKVAGVPDQHMRVEGDSIYIAEFNMLLGAMACVGTTGDEARLVSPSIRRVNPFYISPLDLALYPDGYIHHAVSPNNAVPLDVNEGLEAEDDSGPAATEQHTFVAWLADGPITPVKGAIYTVNFTADLTLVAGGWAFSEIDFPDEMPVGTWAIVGAAMIIDNAVAFRFVPVGAHFRPGGPCQADSELSELSKVFRFGNMGQWCTFQTIRPPGVEVLSSAAQVKITYEGYMDLLRLS